MYIHLKVKGKFKHLFVCYYIIETKQKQNRTVNVALVVFQTIQRESQFVLLSKSTQINKESKS